MTKNPPQHICNLHRKLDALKDGLIHSNSKNKFYKKFNSKIGEYITLALLGLISRANASMAEVTFIAYIAETFKPLELRSYSTNIKEKTNLSFSGVSGKYKILFELQFEVLNTETNKMLHPDLKLTILQHNRGIEKSIATIIIEYEGHPSHLDPDEVKPASIRNREITYQTGAPILPYYKEEVTGKTEREKVLKRINEVVHNKIKEFEGNSEFARKSSNSLRPSFSSLVCCPVCEGSETLEGEFCPACGGVGRVKPYQLQLININNYIDFKCFNCKGDGCLKCNNSGFVSREKAIENSLKGEEI